MSFTITQQTRLDRSNSTSSDASTTDGWLILNGHSRSPSISSPATTPSATDNTYNPFLQLSPVTRGSSVVATQTFTPIEDAEDRQRLFLLRARDN